MLLGIAHQHVGHWQLIAELPGRALGQRAVQDVLPEWAALVGLIVIGLALGFEINRGAVQCRRDRAGKEGAIVAGIVPSKPAFVAAFLPEGGFNIKRFYLGVDHKFNDMFAANVTMDVSNVVGQTSFNNFVTPTASNHDLR